MEMTFYDDSQFRSAKSVGGKSLKRPATLDLESPNTASKKQRFTAILTSPDLSMLKMASPELERFIIANGNLTTTPTPTQILFPKSVTEEQENYARGFIDALNHLHQTTTSFDVVPTTIAFSRSMENQQNSAGGSRTVMSGLMPINLSSPTSVIKSLGSSKGNAAPRPPSADNTNSNSSHLPGVPLEINIKEEYHTVPNDYSSPPMSPISRTPIDMEDQERIKLERKRHRNRIAASKCRRRKLEKISQLEDKVKELKNENAKLEVFADRLREQVCSLKQTVLEHVRKGCQIMIAQHL